MKKLLSILFFFSIFGCVMGQDTIVKYYNNYFWDETHRGDAAYYRIRVTDPTQESDTVMDYYITGQLQWKGRLFPDGKSDGLCVWFYKNGDTLQYLTYKNKQASGKFVSFYPKNFPKEIGFYKKNEKDSIWRNYTKNGDLYLTEKFKKGSRYCYPCSPNKVRKSIEWWEADLSYLDLSNVTVDTIYNNVSSIKRIDIKNKSGKLIGKISYKNDIRHGECYLNYSSHRFDSLIIKVTYKEGLFDGEYYYYSDSDNKKHETKRNYKKGVKQGLEIKNSKHQIDSLYYDNDTVVWWVVLKKGLNGIVTSRRKSNYSDSKLIFSQLESYRLDGTIHSILYDSITSNQKVIYNASMEVIQIDYHSDDSSSSKYFYKDTTFIKVVDKDVFVSRYDKSLRKYGIKRNNKWIIKPKYKWIFNIVDEYFVFYGDDMKRGVLNSKGDTIIHPQYSSIEYVKLAKERTEGYFKRNETTLFIVKENGKSEILDIYANNLTPCDCEYIIPQQSKDSYNYLVLKKDSLYGIYSNTKTIHPKYKYLQQKYNGFAIVATDIPYKGKDVLYGILNDDGEEIIPLKYDEIIFRAKDSLIWVKKNGLIGAYNYEGKLVFDCMYKYDNSNFHYNDFLQEDEFGNKFTTVEDFPVSRYIKYNQSPVVSSDSILSLIKKHKWGLVNTKGKIILDFKYNNIKTLHYKIGNPQKSEIVALCKKDGEWGAVNKLGKLVIPHKYTDAHEIVIFDKQQGLINYYKVFFLVEFKGRYGVIDDNDNVIIPFNYEYGFVEYLYDEFPNIYFVKDRKQYIIPSKELFQNKFSDIEKFRFTSKYREYVFQLPYRGDDTKLAYSISQDSLGLLIVPPIYYDKRELNNSNETIYLFDHVNGGQFILDSKYSVKYKIPHQFVAEKFNDELLYVKTNNKYGIYNPFTQKLIVDTNYVALFKQERTDLFWVKTEFVLNETGKNEINPIEFNWGILNAKGQWILPPEYDFPVTMDKPLIKVSKNHGKFGVINSRGKLLIPCDYEEISIQDNGVIFAKSSLWAIIDTTYNLVCKDLFSFITPYFGNYAIAHTGAELCFIDKEGKIEKRFSSLNELPRHERLIDILNVDYGLSAERYQNYYRIYSWNESHFSDFKSFLESYFPSITVEGETYNKDTSNMIFFENVALVHILQEYRIIPTLYYLASDEFTKDNLIFSEEFYTPYGDYRSEVDPWYINSHPYYGYLTKLMNITDYTISLESSYRIENSSPNEYGKKVKSYYVNGRYWEYTSEYYNYVYSKDTLYQVRLQDILQQSNSLDSLINSSLEDSLRNYRFDIKYSKGYYLNKNSFEELPYTELIWDDFVIDKKGISFYISRNNLIGYFKTRYYNPDYDIEYIVITIPYEKLKPYIKKGSVLENFVK